MKRLVLALAIICALGATAFADIGKEDLKKLARAGISDDVILSYVRSKGPLGKLSADDIIELKAAGLNDGLLSTLVSLAEPASSKPAVPPAPTPSTTAEATAKLLSDPSVVYDGRYYSPPVLLHLRVRRLLLSGARDRRGLLLPGLGFRPLRPGHLGRGSLLHPELFVRALGLRGLRLRRRPDLQPLKAEPGIRGKPS